MFKKELEKLKEEGLFRSMREVGSAQGPRIILDGKEAVNLCSNNYLGLANHPALKEAAIKAIKDFGVGMSASRLISGTTTLHKKLEEKIAEFKGVEAALVFNSGYAANIGIISALAARGDIIFSDKLNHASIVDGCLLSGAELKRYPHCDMQALEEMLKNSYARGQVCQNTSFFTRPVPTKCRLIITDTVFSMDGDIAPLPEIVKLAKKYGCMLMVDEAHATGVLGEKGKGAVEHFGLQNEFAAENFIQMGTLSKALGSFGGYAAGSRRMIDYLINKSRAFIYTTALPASIMASAISALDIVKTQPELRKRLWENVKFFRKGLEGSGLPHFSSTQIMPVLIGDNQKAVKISKGLLDEGIFVQAIRPPTVAKGTARLRITIMATHTREDLEDALNKIRKVIRYEA